MESRDDRSTASVEVQDFLLTPRQILCSKRRFVAAWRKLDRSGFEFDSKTDYQLNCCNVTTIG